MGFVTIFRIKAKNGRPEPDWTFPGDNLISKVDE